MSLLRLRAPVGAPWLRHGFQWRRLGGWQLGYGVDARPLQPRADTRWFADRHAPDGARCKSGRTRTLVAPGVALRPLWTRCLADAGHRPACAPPRLAPRTQKSPGVWRLRGFGNLGGASGTSSPPKKHQSNQRTSPDLAPPVATDS